MTRVARRKAFLLETDPSTHDRMEAPKTGSGQASSGEEPAAPLSPGRIVLSDVEARAEIPQQPSETTDHDTTALHALLDSLVAVTESHARGEECLEDDDTAFHAFMSSLYEDIQGLNGADHETVGSRAVEAAVGD